MDNKRMVLYAALSIVIGGFIIWLSPSTMDRGLLSFLNDPLFPMLVFFGFVVIFSYLLAVKASFYSNYCMTTFGTFTIFSSKEDINVPREVDELGHECFPAYAVYRMWAVKNKYFYWLPGGKENGICIFPLKNKVEVGNNVLANVQYFDCLVGIEEHALLPFHLYKAVVETFKNVDGWSPSYRIYYGEDALFDIRGHDVADINTGTRVRYLNKEISALYKKLDSYISIGHKENSLKIYNSNDGFFDRAYNRRIEEKKEQGGGES